MTARLPELISRSTELERFRRIGVVLFFWDTNAIEPENEPDMCCLATGYPGHVIPNIRLNDSCTGIEKCAWRA